MPNHESIDRACLGLPGATVGSPFGPDNAVYKVGGKMFALLSLEMPRLNVKCEPEQAVLLRETFSGVEPGYHMSKQHWNSIYWEREALTDAQLEQWIRESYALVCAGLPKGIRAALSELTK